MRRPARLAWTTSLCLFVVLLAACQQPPAPTPAKAGGPVQAVEHLADRLRAGDLAGYAASAVPPELHPQLEAAWHAGGPRWPLSELPFGSRLPGMLATFSAPGAEARLQATFSHQFARADRELKAAAATLGLFGAQYVRNEGDFSPGERDHYGQLIDALSAWGRQAPLTDVRRARHAIGQLAAGARATGLASVEDFQAAGMHDSLRRLQPFFMAFKRAAAGYGLDLDRALAGLRADLVEQRGDQASVRLRYRLGAQDIETVVAMQRLSGRWYPVDSMRNARASLPAASGNTPAPDSDVTVPGQEAASPVAPGAAAS